jgi:hypothetical protein
VADLLDSICKLKPNFTSSFSTLKLSLRVTGNFRILLLLTILYMYPISALSTSISSNSSLPLFSSACPVTRLPPPAGSITSLGSIKIYPSGVSMSALIVWCTFILSSLKAITVSESLVSSNGSSSLEKLIVAF